MYIITSCYTVESSGVDMLSISSLLAIQLSQVELIC